MAPSQNADDGNCPDCHKSLAANRGHLENIFYNQMSPVFYPCASIYKLFTTSSFFTSSDAEAFRLEDLNPHESACSTFRGFRRGYGMYRIEFLPISRGCGEVGKQPSHTRCKDTH